MSIRLSENFTLAEFTASQTAARKGIDNTLPGELLPNARHTAKKLQDVRSFLGNRPMHITSGYRCPALNRAIGGSRLSAHMMADAADFVCPTFGSPIQIVRKLAKELYDFDQLILEFDEWVHVSFAADCRGEVLTIRRVDGKVRKFNGIVRP